MIKFEIMYDWGPHGCDITTTSRIFERCCIECLNEVIGSDVYKMDIATHTSAHRSLSIGTEMTRFHFTFQIIESVRVRLLLQGVDVRQLLCDEILPTDLYSIRQL